MGNVTPVTGPFAALLKSRKALVALLTALANILVVWLVAKVPELAPYTAELLAVFTALGGVLIGSIAYEDGKGSILEVVGTAEVTEDAQG